MKTKTLIGLILFLSYPYIGQFLSLDLKLFEVAMWLLLGFILLWIYLVEKKTIASIGWKKVGIKTVLYGTGLGVVMFIIFGICTVLIQTIGLELNQDVAKLIAGQPLPFLLLIALRAAVVEEVLYRAFAFERLLELTKSKFIAGIIPVILFTLVHLEWGVGHLFFVFIVGGLFMLVYIMKRNLTMVIVAHFVTDVLALVVLPLLIK